MPILRLPMLWGPALILIAAVPRAANAQQEDEPELPAASPRELSDEALEQRLEGLLAKDDFRWRRTEEFQAFLLEAVRRGGDRWTAVLSRQLTALNQRKFGDDELADPGTYFNQALLTALRRAQGKPDPLRIFVECPDPLVVERTARPRLKVTIKNVDAEAEAVGFTFGGNYRTGRQARWRVRVVDAQGEELPPKRAASFTGGGIYQTGNLEYGKGWETTLDLRSFIVLPPPGKYRLQVLYNDTETIAGRRSVDGLIVSSSDLIELVVEPATIRVTAAQREAARRWISALETPDRVKVVAGTYGKWAHEFIDPASPAGKLLAMGLPAAPPLIAALQDKESSATKRAWLLALLYSVTGDHDPRSGAVLGSYDVREGGWQIWGGRPGEAPSGGIGFGGTSSSGGGKIDPQAQARLTQEWVQWLKEARVVSGDEPEPGTPDP